MYDMSSGLVFRPLLYNYDIFRTLICKISYLNRPYFIPMTFSEIYALWKEEKARTLKKASYSTYVLTVDSYILPMLADKEDITEEDKDAVFEHILSQGLKPLTALRSHTTPTFLTSVRASRARLILKSFSET